MHACKNTAIRNDTVLLISSSADVSGLISGANTYVLTNIVPQNSSFNNGGDTIFVITEDLSVDCGYYYNNIGVWKSSEVKERKIAKKHGYAYVIAGPSSLERYTCV